VNALTYKLFWLSAAAILAWAANVPIADSQATNLEGRSASALIEGRQLLASNCGACHGIDGKGSERAPNIADSPHMRQLSDAQLEHIIADGIPGTGMPAFHSLSNSRIHELIAYLRSLEGKANNAKLPGAPQKGEAVFFGQARCSNCHMIAGRGGFIASDLTDYARTHSAEQIRSAILDSSSGDKGQVRLATATVRSGERIVGRVRNEDNFSLQLQSMDGTFHFIMKSELEKLEYDSQPLMPTNFGSSLTASELNDLISYLLTAAGNTDPQKRANENDMDNLED
jgi:cytochrome c oxidase cbb3-type subunit III